MEYFFWTEQMSVGYHGQPLIENVGIRLKKGEILTLIGPLGVGKSTVLKSIARQLALLAGTVYLDGRSLGPKKENGSILIWYRKRRKCAAAQQIIRAAFV